jgi:cell division septum initiation protein DivIVA
VSIIDQIAFDQIADERDKAQQENKLLKQRIKRLEEAGDCMAYCETEDFEVLVASWNKAKEAKP